MPSAANTWANSMAMYPPPRMTIEAGCSGSRMMSSFVRYVTPEASIASGTKGRDPAATTTWSPEITRTSLP